MTTITCCLFMTSAGSLLVVLTAQLLVSATRPSDAEHRNPVRGIHGLGPHSIEPFKPRLFVLRAVFYQRIARSSKRIRMSSTNLCGRTQIYGNQPNKRY